MDSRLEKNSSLVRKRIENHTFTDEGGDEYEPSSFGGAGDYLRRKKIKLQNLDADMRASSSDKPQIFKGIVAHVMGYTQPPLHILHRDLVQHGAGFLQYLDSKTMATHIIASALPPKKAVDYSRYRMVKPAWVVDSIQAGKLLPWSNYRVVDEGPRQKVLKFGEGNRLSQASPKSQTGYREQTDQSFYTSQFKSPSNQAATPSEVPAPKLTGIEPLSSPSKHPSASRAGSVAQMGDLVDNDIDESMLADIFAASDTRGQTSVGSNAPATPAGAVPVPVERTSPPIPVPVLAPQRGSVSLEKPKPENMTSEEHNAWLLSDPRIRKSSTANPEFLKQFYSESRLHHLSTWKAELKTKMQRLAAEKWSSVRVAKKKANSRRYILHVDFDSFFCAVSLKRNPEYAALPTVVAHSSGTGSEIASCNYPARSFGVKNGMWMKRAMELCPELKVLPYDFSAYEEASRLFYESILDVGGVVQSVSIDEALLDVTGLVQHAVGSTASGADEDIMRREQDLVDQIALNLRNTVKSKTGCDVSVGIGGNILQAKVALRRAKPAGQFQLKPEEVIDMIGELQVGALPGVAYSISGKLEEMGIKFVKDIRQASKEKLSSTLGPKTGEKLWEYARGIDRTDVGEQPPRKSVSAEVNWGIRFISQPEAEEFVMNLCKELERRLLNEQVKGKNLTMKIMRRSLDAPLDPVKHLGHGKCDSFSKSTVFGVATHSAEIIGKEAVSILRSYKFSPGDLRGLGVQMTKLEAIKSLPSGVDSSQRRLTFLPFGAPSSAKKGKADPILEDAAGGEPSPSAALSARKSRADPIDDRLEAPDSIKQRTSSQRDVASDPIADDPLTPRKPKSSSVHPALALARAGESDAKATTPLNIAGTQFLIPTQVDPAVLAELPSDIRAKLQGRQKQLSFGRQGSPSVRTSSRSRGQSPAFATENVPLPSQVDPEVFSALPEDMKAEVLASFGRRSPAFAPQSPRRNKPAQPKKTTTPTKRGGIRGAWSKKELQADVAANRMQTNFAPPRQVAAPTMEENDPEELEDLDPEFLAEIPEDVRREIVEDHRRKRLAQKSGLNFQAAPRRHVNDSDDAGSSEGGGIVSFLPPPKKVVFQGTNLSATEDIQEMLEAWYTQSKESGPHRDDVQVFETYLSKVVLEERDMSKVSKLVRWVDFLVSADAGSAASLSEGIRGWVDAVEGVKSAVQKAVRERGLGPLRF